MSDPVSGEPDLLSLVRRAAAVADHNKGGDTLIIDVGDVLGVSDYFVITSAPNRRLVRAITAEIEDQVRSVGGPSPVRIEGIDECEWVLMDYGPFVVHVFRDAQREFYRLEKIWQDCPQLAWTPLRSADGPAVDSA